MIKLVAIILAAWIAFLLFPGALATLAGFALVVAIVALILSGMGYLFSVIGSTMAALLSVLFTLLIGLVVVVACMVGFPVLLLLAIPLGMLLFVGGLFLSLVCCFA